MSQPSPIPESILDAATDWLVLIHSGEITEIQLQQFEQWKSERKEHALAISQIERFTQGLSGLPSSFQPDALVESKQKFNTSLKHKMLFGLSGFLVLGLSAYSMPWAKWQADYHTQVGKIKTVPLADGTKLILASNSYVNVDFSKQTRQIELVEGEIYIQTAKDPQHRPFMVTTQDGKIEALGTQFTVRQEDRKRTKVKVYEHAVALYPAETTTRKLLQQGQRTSFDASSISAINPLQNDQPYWTQHLLVVEQWPLKKVLDELYRYQNGTYFIDPELETVRVSGVFSLKDPKQSLENLAYTHQLELDYYSAYLLKIKKR